MMEGKRLRLSKIDIHGRNVSYFIRLGERTHTGGEGEIYSVEGEPEILGKIYSDVSFQNPGIRKFKMEKIRKMMLKPPERRDGLAWPEALLFDGHESPENFVGFTMRRFSNMEMLENVYTTETRFELLENIQWENLRRWSSLFMIALNLSIIMEDICRKGYIIADLSPANILVDPDMRVALIDCDSFIIRGENEYGRIVGNPEYTAPERLKIKKMGNTDEASWRFSFAVLIFRILMLGYHPFRGIYPHNPEYTETENIINGNTPYFGGSGSRQYGSPAESAIPEPLKTLFVRAFIYGVKSPMIRPDFTEWRKNLQYVYELRHEKFYICGKSPNHIFYENSLNICPWCRIEEEWGSDDPFPPAEGINIIKNGL